MGQRNPDDHVLGIVKEMLVPSLDIDMGLRTSAENTVVPKSITSLEVNPDPYIVTIVPTIPDIGESDWMEGVAEILLVLPVVTVKGSALLVTFPFVTETLYIPGLVGG